MAELVSRVLQILTYTQLSKSFDRETDPIARDAGS